MLFFTLFLILYIAMCYKVFSRNGVISIRNNVISLLFVVLFVNLGIVVGGYHWRFVHPRPYRNYSTQAASSSPTRACFPPTCPSSLLLSQPCLHLPHQARQAYHGRQPRHSSHEPEVAWCAVGFADSTPKSN